MSIKRFGMVVAAAALFFFTISCALFGTPRGPLQFEPADLPVAQVGMPYEADVKITGNVTPVGEFSISEGALPRGLTLEKVQGEDTARISGTPEQAGTFTFRVFVWCYGTNVSGQTGEQDYSLIVK